jgi:hypothetical protein
MSERMTDITGPGVGGLMEYGRKSRAEMIASFRAYHERQREQAERALAIPDEDLTVTTFLGPYAMRNREVVT